MSKHKSAERKKAQRARKALREAHLSPEMKESFSAINKWIDDFHRRNANKKKGCTFVRDNRRKLIILSERQNHRCCYCGGDTWHPDIIDYQLDRSKSNRATIEHLLTRSQGGTFHWDNIAMACSECNTARGTMPIEEFLASIQAAAKPKTKKSKAELQKDVSLAKARKLKVAKSECNRFRLFMTAAWMFPVDYKYVMENISKGDVKRVHKGGRRGTTPRRHLMKKIRRRVIENRMVA